MNKVLLPILGIIGVIAIAIIGGLILAWPTMLLWNQCLVPAVTGIHTIGWTQAWGLIALFSILFKTTISSTDKT